MWKEFAEDEYSAAPRNELCLLDLVDTKPTLPAQVDSLTRQLGNDDSDTRDKAERSIIALGPRCLPLLAGGLKHPDPEIRLRANTIVQHYLDIVSEEPFSDEELSPQSFASTTVGTLTRCAKTVAMT